MSNFEELSCKKVSNFYSYFFSFFCLYFCYSFVVSWCCNDNQWKLGASLQCQKKKCYVITIIRRLHPPLPIVLIVYIWKISKNKSLHFTSFFLFVFMLLKSFNRWVISHLCCGKMIKIYLYILHGLIYVLKYICHSTYMHIFLACCEFIYDGVLSFYLSNFFFYNFTYCWYSFAK